MALKTFINGNMINLTSTAKPLTTFVGGVKKTLTKGVTFINGEEVVLWNANKLQITYINPADLGASSSFPTTAFLASKDYLFYSYNNKIFKIDVSNLGNITVTQTLNLGNVAGFSSVDSDVGTSVFYAYDRSSGSTTTFNQINIVNQTGAITASNAGTYNISYSPNLAQGVLLDSVAYVNSSWLNANYIVNAYKLVNVREGQTVKYGYTGFGTASLSGMIDGPRFTKIDSTTAVGRIHLYSNGNYTDAIAEYDGTAYTIKSGTLQYIDFLTDGTEVCCAGASGFGIYERNTSGNYTEVVHQARIDTYHTERLIGKCRGYYYTVSCPNGSGGDGKFYLRVYRSNGTVYETVELTGLSNMSGGTGDLRFVPQLSRTGYLTFFIQRKTSSQNNSFVLIQCY